ncbi:MAG: AIR synthase-related protein, partial [Chloroflexota bacterium]
EKRKFDPGTTARLNQAFHRPQPRIAEGQLLAGHGVKAAIDISDGLLADLGHICTHSRVGARVEVERVPVSPAARAGFGEAARELALAGGEDYELLFTGPPEVIDNVKAAACPFTVIGEITAAQDRKIALVDGQGKPVSLDRTGWEHFTHSG